MFFFHISSNHFRKLTDKPKDEPVPVILSDSIDNLEELGKGNTFLVPSFVNDAGNLTKKLEPISVEKSARTESPKADEVNECSENLAESHMIMHKGALIDVEKLLQQLNRSEKAREETEFRLTELTKTHADLQSSSSKAKDKIKDLQSELKSCNRKINDSDSNLSSANVGYLIQLQKDSNYIILFFFSIYRKNLRNIIRFYVVFMIKSVQFLSRVNEVHRKKSHPGEFEYLEQIVLCKCLMDFIFFSYKKS